MLFIHLDFRNYVEDEVSKEIFSMAYDEVLKGRRHHIIVVLVDQPRPGDLPSQLEYYLRHHPCVEANHPAANLEIIQEKIRCAMPNTPIRQLKVLLL